MIKRKIKKIIGNIILASIESLEISKNEKLYSVLKIAHTTEKYRKIREKFLIREDFRFNGDEILFYGNGKISCGSNSYIGNYSTILAYDNCLVEIGNNCSISHNVRIYTSSKTSDQDLNHTGSKTKKTGNVIIKDGSWIGANVFINPGITIGENSIVGSNSVVTKNVEPNAIYGGIPAKLIRYKS
jgi:maltose O-acetyltransferase